eukprot:c9834_g1_i10.p1 GENE.c9834_g1_i10~~c9834_g1_i10.p1  ORF type:complete len:182 (+),score=18.07 c9834_g1_i10:62-547(+)
MHDSTLQQKILGSRTTLTNCADNFESEWKSFFDVASNPNNLLSWIHCPQSPPDLALPAQPTPKIDDAMPLEPLVCSNPQTAEAWAQARKGTQEICISKHLHQDDVLVIAADDQSREEDAEAGYFLPLSFGKVLEVNEAHVRVQWLFADGFDTKFRPWTDSW